MIDLKNISHIYLYPGATDMRLGINGLRKQIDNIEDNSLYIFCSSNRRTIKIIQTTIDAVWLYQKKLFKNKFLYPSIDNNELIDIDEFLYIIEGISSINKIELKHKNKHIDFI